MKLAERGMWQELAEQALEHEQLIWETTQHRRATKEPKPPEPINEDQEIPGEALERAVEHISGRGYKPARRLLQNSALLPACKQTATAVKKLFITDDRKLDAREEQEQADERYQGDTDIDGLTSVERRRLERLWPRNKGIKPPTIKRRIIKKRCINRKHI